MRTKEEQQAYNKAYYKKNRARILKRSSDYHKSHRGDKARRQRKYFSVSKWSRVPGWTKELYERIYEEQGGRCAVCGDKHKTLCRDHDHATGKPRALLCHSCNLMLGNSRDNSANLIAGATYLRMYS